MKIENNSGDNLKAYSKDAVHVEDYYLRYFKNKSEQQKRLEAILLQNFPEKNKAIADVACGAGSLTWHLQGLFKESQFSLLDLNEHALELAKKQFPTSEKFKILKKNIYELSEFKNSFDLVFCWQTLSWIDRPLDAIDQLISICKPGGRLYLSFLFNFDHDVDVTTFLTDFTKPSGKEGLYMQNNTYSMPTLVKWLKGKVAHFKIVPFVPEIDFEYTGRGIGTYTVKKENGQRLQLSAGMTMNWGILEIIK